MRRLLLLLPLLLWLPVTGSAQTNAFVPDERAYYGLIDRGSGRCLDVASASTASGAAVVQWEFTHANSQQWRFVPVRQGSEYYRIEARHSTQCLTVATAGEGTALVQRPFQGSAEQQWRLVPAGPLGSFQLENKSEARVAALAAADKFNGTPVVAQKSNGRATQQWRLFRLRLNLLDGPSPFGAPQLLAGPVNSPGNELHPILSPDGSVLYFARTKFAGNTEGNTDSGDAWLSHSQNNGQTWGAPERLDAINTQQNNEVVAALRDNLLLRGTYEANGFRDEGLSRVTAQAATSGVAKGVRPAPVAIANLYSASPATGFFVSSGTGPRDPIVLLSLERGDSEGGNDLYVSFHEASGSYSAPLSLGPVLNSPGFDFAPWLAPDGKTLYFASYGHMGYGSADLFVSTRLDDSWTRWSEPRNLGPALNGPGFNAYLSLTADGKTAYYSSSATANGTKDIFRTGRAVAADSLPKPVVAEVSETDGRAFLSGRVLDARTKQPVPGALVKANLLGTGRNSPQFLATSRADNSGNYQMSLLPGRYALSAIGGLLTMSDTISVSGSPRRDVLLSPAVVGEKVDLPSIIFAQGKATLLGSSFIELNRLAIALQAAPATEVRLEGHTDNVGPADKNQQLSEDRVAEVKRDLVGRGINENRITTVGFGGAKPRYGNDREETRRRNRRVELVIVK